jgi:2-polyprenyl-3-methyl-5-hydroxy-6-metoxy-1,4-benzoquinol methylase
MDEHVCPSGFYPTLDVGFRKHFHNHDKIFSPYVKPGYKVADVGCGPGYFSVGLARIVGEAGNVTACDIQEEGLERLKNKILGTPIQKIISIQKATNETIGLDGKYDFILSFWMLHEVNNKEKFVAQIKAAMKPGSLYMLVEPRFHVVSKAFKQEVEIAINAGLKPVDYPKIWMSRSVVFKNPRE